jgi:predicted enzyme related to lactoylglutathione lyase
MIVEATVTVLVSDVDAALCFYTQLLGLTLKERYSAKYAEVEAHGLVLGLHLMSSGYSETSISSNVSLGFRVEDLDAEIEALRAKGLVFSSDVEDGHGGRFIYFQDRDGNPLYLWQRKPN